LNRGRADSRSAGGDREVPYAVARGSRIVELPWVALPPGARTFEGYYQPEQEWPAESLARRKAALGL